ncbi:myelin protein zero-like protein 2 [Hemiscyllium ocellatum]|uniref:myelin protein zero-like protein 2 n=1 Tax=Hemiscyllium ocellatum TaxID=170820 RepID=UPI00296764B8|nr:myelin protein zero-like protein 2 [Hemiscyllium ocellatum]
MYSQNPIWMLAWALIFPGISGVAAVDIYTSGNIEARNGTEKRLKCTFQSSSPVSKRTTVTWHFRRPDSSNEESVFYYHEEPFPPSGGRFKDRISWSGNIWKKDGSITISNLQFTDNGTFLCSVKNPPDVHGVAGEIKLSVVHKVTYSEMMILGIVIGCATGLVVLIVIAVVGVQLLRKNRAQQEEDEMEYEEEKELNYEHQNGMELQKSDHEPELLMEGSETAAVS